MKNNINLWVAALLGGVALMTGACTKDVPDTENIQPQPPVTQNVANEVIVKFAPSVSEILDSAALTRSGSEMTRSGIMSVDEVLGAVSGCQLERVFPVDASAEERTRQAGLHLWYVVRFSDDVSVEEMTERLSRLGEVQNAMPNRLLKRSYNTEAKPLSKQALAAMKTRATAVASEYAFNDELLPHQWHLINRGDMFVSDDFVKSVAGADVGCEKAWEMSTGHPEIIVAILDEGVCLEHPELEANMWHNEGEIYHSREDNDGNGYKGDYYGYNFARNTGVISWDNLGDSGHATHVAGVIAAQNNNGMGISSIAGGTPDSPGVKIMTCQIFAGGMAGNSLTMAKAIKYAADNGAVILQCSFGYTSGMANGYEWGYDGFTSQDDWEYYCPLEKEAFEYFTHNAGSPNGPIDGGIAIFAAGNESAPMAGFPGAAKQHVSVAATAADFTPAVYSNYGDFVTISAPGGDQNYYYEYGGDNGDNTDYDKNGSPDEFGEIGCVLSTLPEYISESGYGYMEGTSMACPHVSGVVALGLSYAMQLRKHFTADEFRALLHETVTPIDEYMSGTKTYYRYVADIGKLQKMQMTLSSYRNRMGAGQVNAERLLKAIEGSGRPIEFPNIYISPESEVTVIPANYFVGGESLTYKVDIADTSIATCTADGNRLKFRGLKTGATNATITTSAGTVQSFTITVRKGANDKGWL